MKIHASEFASDLASRRGEEGEGNNPANTLVVFRLGKQFVELFFAPLLNDSDESDVTGLDISQLSRNVLGLVYAAKIQLEGLELSARVD